LVAPIPVLGLKFSNACSYEVTPIEKFPQRKLLVESSKLALPIDRIGALSAATAAGIGKVEESNEPVELSGVEGPVSSPGSP
jgi:hypothetical protein